MPLHRVLAIAVLALSGVSTARAAGVDPARAAMCRDLGRIAYYTASSELSRHDRARLGKAERLAARPTPERPAIRRDFIREAGGQGIASLGVHGLGLTRLDIARADGVDAALGVNRQCLWFEAAYPATPPGRPAAFDRARAATCSDRGTTAYHAATARLSRDHAVLLALDTHRQCLLAGDAFQAAPPARP